MQKIILNSLAAVIHKNKHNAASNSEKVVHPCPSLLFDSGCLHLPGFKFFPITCS